MTPTDRHPLHPVLRHGAVLPLGASILTCLHPDQVGTGWMTSGLDEDG